MAEFNDLTIWTDAIAGDTTGLSDAEFGAYLRLLMAAWRRPECDIPDDASWMRRTAQTPANWWPRRWAAIEPFWRRTENSHGEPVWVQKKLLKERERRRLFRSKQAEAANARWDQERAKKPSGQPVHKTPERKAHRSPVPPHLLESGAEPAQKEFQGLNLPDRICPAYAPESRIPRSRDSSSIPSLDLPGLKEGFSHKDSGTNGKGFGPGSYTIADPDQRIARFQKKLATALGNEGWKIIFIAMDPTHPAHETALAQCKRTARSVLKKGWPTLWPRDPTLHRPAAGAA